MILSRRSMSQAAVAFGVGMTILFAGAVPANAATHNTVQQTIKGGKTKYVLKTFNTTNRQVKVNVGCMSKTWRKDPSFIIYRANDHKVMLQGDLNMYQGAYVDRYYAVSAHRKYASYGAFRKDYIRINSFSNESLRDKLGVYCMRDARRDEVHRKVKDLQAQLAAYLEQHPEAYEVNTGMVDVNRYRTAHSFAQSYGIVGVRNAYTVTGWDSKDGYQWVYDSTTDAFREYQKLT